VIVLGLDRTVVTIDFLVYLTYALWVFLVARDVIRTRAEVRHPVSSGWIIFALIVPFGTVVWVLYRRRLLARERAESQPVAAEP